MATKKQNHRYAKKRALRHNIGEMSAKRDTIRAGRRNYGGGESPDDYNSPFRNKLEFEGTKDSK